MDIDFPVSTLPVNDILLIRGFLIISSPILLLWPVTVLITPAGKCFAMICVNFKAARGALIDGFNITVFLAAIAGAILCTAKFTG